LGPLNISVKGEYALLALFDLSTQPPGEPIKIAAIAKRQKIPQKFLELILAQLKQGGFVESRRGAEGGYLMARSPGQISVGEVLRHVEGVKARGRPRHQETPFTEVWDQVERAISSILDQTNFQALARRWQERRARYIPNWQI
jgi:Rrf2 family cysteine metabolism transcriptional repressor